MTANRHRFLIQLTVPSNHLLALHKRFRSQAALWGCISITLFTPQAFAQETSKTAPVPTTLEPAITAELCYGSAEPLTNGSVTTSQTICQSGLTPPSLWWTRDQVAKQLRTSRKLVKDWTAQLKTDSSPGTVSLVVNPQMWSVMDYFERYDFINSFGLTARDFGYQTEVYNTKSQRLAGYNCNVKAKPVLLGNNCTIDFGSSNLGVRGTGGRRGLLQ